MDIPTYITNPRKPEESEAPTGEENYQEELNQTLRQNLGPNGWSITNITDADLTTTPVLDPNLGTFTTIKDLMPVGTVWFVTDATPPTWVGKQSAGPTVLVKFTTTAYP